MIHGGNQAAVGFLIAGSHREWLQSRRNGMQKYGQVWLVLLMVLWLSPCQGAGKAPQRPNA